MAQFDYMATFDESWAMLQDIFSRGDIRAYVGQGPFETRSAPMFRAATDELKLLLRRHRSLLYLAGSFSTHPPLFVKQTEGRDAGKYLLFEGEGGPFISFSIASINENLKLLLLGGLLTQSTYELEEGHYEKPSQALKDAYADFSKRMKRHLIRYKQSIWIGPEALNLFESGKLKIKALGVLQDLAKYDDAHPPASSRSAPAQGKIQRRRDLAAAKVVTE